VIQQKPKVLFVNFSERGSLDYGLILKKKMRAFRIVIWERKSNYWLILGKSEGCFAK